MNELLMYHLVRDLVDERHTVAARHRQLQDAFPDGAIRRRWWGPRNISRRRRANPVPARSFAQ